VFENVPFELEVERLHQYQRLVLLGGKPHKLDNIGKSSYQIVLLTGGTEGDIAQGCAGC
jgi:hypothetical protein